MPETRSILFADDEDSFLRSTAELLRGDGYDCDAVSDAHQALEKLRGKRYDLLIADIKMPGNANLELIQEAQELAPGLPVILVTGYPSLDSAIQSIQLPVVAYLEKPVRYDDLQRHVQASLEYSQAYRTVSQIQEQLGRCIDELEHVKHHRSLPKQTEDRRSITVPAVTLRSLIACVSGLLSLSTTADSAKGRPILCERLDCPQWAAHRDAMRKAVNVLQETKRRFKSKELADIRDMLERLLG